MKSRAALMLLWPLCLLAAAVGLLWMLASILVGGARAWQIAVGFDQLANAAFGGDVDETISSRAYKASRRRKRWGCILCRLLDTIDPDHCRRSVELDEGDALPADTEI